MLHEPNAKLLKKFTPFVMEEMHVFATVCQPFRKNKKSEESAEADETPEPEQSEESAEAEMKEEK